MAKVGKDRLNVIGVQAVSRSLGFQCHPFWTFTNRSAVIREYDFDAGCFPWAPTLCPKSHVRVNWNHDGRNLRFISWNCELQNGVLITLLLKRILPHFSRI